MKTRDFDLGDVLSITTGHLVSRRHMDGVYDILNFMTGDNLFTHQLPRAADECKPWLLRWFPELAKAGTSKNLARLGELIDCTEHRKESPAVAVEMWLKWMAEPGTCNLKKTYTVQAIPRDDHDIKDPVEELKELVPEHKIFVVDVP